MNSFNTLSDLSVGDRSYRIHLLSSMPAEYKVERLPYSIKILLENLLRREDGYSITKDDIAALAQWDANAQPSAQVAFTPARVVLQDFTGVPVVVDLAAMRDAMMSLGGDPKLINPLEPVDLVIDHSVMVDYFGDNDALARNTQIEFERNEERYKFLRWGQKAFSNFRVVPPGTGIVHQVNLEYLGQVVMQKEIDGEWFAYPDTLVGTDSHTTMINGLGVLGWGVGGIEAEAAMLGQPVSMLAPEVVGFKFTGKLPEGATATDLVLTVTQMLRKKGVVGKFVEFYGDGLDHLPLADRATIANMAPEYGATCGIFPVDKETLAYLRLSGREDNLINLVETYTKAQGLWRETGASPAEYSETLTLDLGSVIPSLAGPKRPQDRVALSDAKESFESTLKDYLDLSPASDSKTEQGHSGESHQLQHGDVVIAAITSCTNTSNPAVMLAAGLVARNARQRGLNVKPWVKTSLAPGSQVVPAYLKAAGLMDDLEALGFNLVGFGCTTCIGNSGPLPEAVQNAIRKDKLMVASVLSGNRNFEGRIHPEVRANYLASPPLVVAYALAGSMRMNIYKDSLGKDKNGEDVYLKDIWPSQKEVADLIAATVSSERYRSQYADVFAGTDAWRALPVPEGKTYDWPDSSYIKKPPFFDGMTLSPPPLPIIEQARALVKVGDSITTDHISPAGSIAPDSPAGKYLLECGVEKRDFNSLGSRRGNHEVMMRGTFANVRLRNQLAPETEGGWTTHWPSGEVISIFDAASRYRENGTPLIVIAGKEYGSGSSRDWAAKGVSLLGVRVVLAESYERIHRSNLVGFGVLPLQFKAGESAQTLNLNGEETYSFGSLEDSPKSISVTAVDKEGSKKTFDMDVRIDTPTEWDYYRHGGILQYVVRDLASKSKS
ncbi:aconitate hydratase AcnA [Hahella sp. KA22]|uniref:aconitate hydratase AcnA n=1 Tax=Hahella sp. KA22 TaxID=1628392 RepID=UPI000FDEBBEA|nr:aconitate hydratase AcnA [Hahella sp. KA22]AZZ95191.1 aconitate hydratase AcnA [Hahella sp. KA22]QAY52836.1 aconitate hydratase AcnA [Hahella sp. KA22]